MSLLYDQYLHYYHAAQQALAEQNSEDARRNLLMASRCVLEIAAETTDPVLRESRKKKGLRLLDLARKVPRVGDSRQAGNLPHNENGATGRHDSPKSGDPAGEEERTPNADRWQVTERPNVRFNDIAGLEAVKDLIHRRVLLPFRNPELAGQYRRKPGGGILMYGPPGTGKTMMAKAIAAELDAPFFNIKCSDILSKWVGEAEANMKELFEAARARTPSVIFFDETEALIPHRGSNSTVMNRVIPEFLAQVDGLTAGPGGLLLLGATNRPWDIDAAALRPGRFGERIYIDLPDQPARRFILGQSLGKIPCESDVDLDDIAARTDGLSGADLQGLVDRIVDPVFEQAMVQGRPIPVRRADVERGLKETKPSVSQRDLARYEKFRKEGD